MVGETARDLFDDAQAMLQRIVGEKWLTARGVIGLWPANRVGDDDIELYTDEEPRRRSRRRPYAAPAEDRKGKDRVQFALADFVAPKETGVADYMGAFAVTAGFGVDALAEDYEKHHDDYNAIMVKALADRLAEAFAERMHERVRTEFWGYADGEALTNEDLIAEKYRGHPPGAGLSRLPRPHRKADAVRSARGREQRRHHADRELRHDARRGGQRLLLRPPRSRYFGVGRIGRDQVEDYARRKGMDVKAMERWLAPNLAYDPGVGEG